ncbi:flagellar hook-associated protein FliD [Gracilibacillus boraciitolerans JCM 21714]|uniref:Filament cap protein n=1 Tax=Gracilibacillus boraciitolerans JCM 21714 TaxID=1298598 RepID=W4VQK8_9BACI|nr:flagellar cap protein FliD N-terminal domain-containing protein [Gracilibacillus boraciitolerans]GAE95173.1 flagellar hook-associated protein FliD [Gracilibacillus boraciitolerans JCM 21714]
MRISGFASGMDIDQMVKDLMKAESMPLQRMQQEKQTLEWKRDDYRSINTLLLDFRSTLTDMRMTTSYRARETSSTNENLVSATASSAASQSSFSLSEVSQLASSATWVNEGKISDSNIDPTKGMYAQDAFTGNFEWQQGAIFKETVTATSNNQTIAIDSTTGNVQTDAVNVQINGKGGFEVVTEEVLAGEPLAANQALLKDGELTFADGVLKADDKVSVQFVTDGQKNDSVELASAAKAFQLSGGSISTENFQLTVDAVNYTIGPASQNENEYSLIDENSNSIGTFNVNTGRITFTDEQPEGTVIDAKYQQNYAAFSVGAETSKGTTYQNFLLRVMNH